MKLLVYFLLFLNCLTSLAQPPTKFYTRIGGAGYDNGNDVKQTLDNGYIITGSTSSFGQGNTDLYLLKLDSMGQIKFEKAIGNHDNEVGRSVVQLLDSSFVTVGYTNSIGFGGYDVYLIKTDKAGNVLWQKTIGGADWDFAYSLQQTTDGGFIIGGTTYSSGYGNADGYVIKTDALGNVTWSKTFGGVNDDEFKSVIQTADGGYALTGYTKSYNDIDSGDVWVFKLDLNGDSLWSKYYGGSKEDFGNEIIESTITGEFFVAGASASIGVGLLDGYVFRINNTGNFINYGSDGTATGNEEFTSVQFSSRSPNIVALGEKEIFPAYNLQFKIIEIISVISYVNATEYGSTSDDEIFKIIPTKDRGYAGVGYTKGYGASNKDVYFLKIDSTLFGSTSIVSVKENNEIDFKFNVFPNPVLDNEIIITSEKSLIDFHLNLINNLGQECEIKNNISYLSNNNIVINLKEIPNGIYYLSIGNKIEKLIILK